MESDENLGSCFFVPEMLLRKLADDESEDATVRSAAVHTLEIDEKLESTEDVEIEPPNSALQSAASQATNLWNIYIYDAGHKYVLPGVIEIDGPFWGEHRPAGPLWHRLRNVYELFTEVYNFTPLDGKGTDIRATVRYGQKYGNIFWSGKNSMLVAGDGDSYITADFCSSREIIAHEVTHGIIDKTSRLAYRNEAGALNEHLADVFGILCEQYSRFKSNSRENRDLPWLLGAEAFIARDTSGIVHVGPESGMTRQGYLFGRKTDVKRPGFLRSFNDPGSAVPWQPSHWKDYQKMPCDRKNDWGGVHTNSGIPNFAFYNAAINADGPPWEGVGKVWFRAMTDKQLGRNCTFKDFASATVKYARQEHEQLERTIAKAWDAVGVQY